MLKWFKRKMGLEGQQPGVDAEEDLAPQGEASSDSEEPAAGASEKSHADADPRESPTEDRSDSGGVDVELSPQYAEREEGPPSGYPNIEVRPKIAPSTSSAAETAYSLPTHIHLGQPGTTPTTPDKPELGAGRDEDVVVDKNDSGTGPEEMAPAAPSPAGGPSRPESKEAGELPPAGLRMFTMPEPTRDIVETPAAPATAKGFFGKLRDRLGKTTEVLVDRVRTAIGLHAQVDEELLEQIEEILLQSDVGVETTGKIIDRMREEGGKVEGEQAVMGLFKRIILEILDQGNRPLQFPAPPTIMLVVGVNGSGKTTTIGKLAKQLSDAGRTVMLVAADTFRAAAGAQLTIWAERTGSAIVMQPEGADPAAVVFEALEGARQGPTPDVILIDTAGRLQTKVNLMEQLKKIDRVIRKHYPEAPHETVLVLDATTGQNALSQVKLFNEATRLTGLIMTKLDGTAKGGILIACKDIHGLPVFKIGIGEGIGDLRDFDPAQFVEALFAGRG